MIDERIIDLQGVHNFRDYGGYAVPGGGRLRRGMFFRSGQHARATEQDLAAIDSLGIGTIFDLRGTSERRDYPCRRGDAFCASVLFEEGETASLPPHLRTNLSGLSEPEMIERTKETYRGLPFRPALSAMLRRYFASLAEADGANLIHCFAGKDRTGISVSLFHTLMGVHHDDMLEDYLLTNVAHDRDRHMAEIGEFMSKRVGPMSEAALRVMTGVYPEWLDAAYAEITSKYGSLENYFEQGLGVDAAKREAIRQRAIES